MQDSIICTLQDAVTGKGSVADALVKIPVTAEKKKRRGARGKKPFSEAGELWLLPSSVGGAGCVAGFEGESAFTDDGVCSALTEAAEAADAEYVIIDTGAGVNSAVGAAAAIADTALVVSGHMPVALRSAQTTVARLSSYGVGDIRLLINSFDASGVIDDRRKGLFSVIDESGAALAGVIPYDYGLLLTHEGIASPGGEAEGAFLNIARRLCGESVPVFEGIKRIRKLKKKIYQ